MEKEDGRIFGVEIEFHIEVPSNYAGFPLRDGAVRKALAKRLAQLTNLPIACSCSHGEGVLSCDVCDDATPDIKYPHGRVVSPGQPIHTADWHPAYQYFNLQQEALSHAWIEEFRYFGAEISTPIFPYAELTAKMPKLTEIISAMGELDVRVETDAACGLHIHVGLKKGMTLLLAKKFVTIVMLLEQSLLRSLLPEFRRARSWSRGITTDSMVACGQPSRAYIEEDLKRPCSAMASHFCLTRRDMKSASWNSNNLDNWYATLRVFWQTKSLDQLKVFMSKMGASKLGLAIVLRKTYGVEGGDDGYENSPSTFELRYPEMVFSMAHIQNWAEIGCSITDIAELDAADFRKKVFEIHDALEIQSSAPAWKHLLPVIGLGHQIEFWEQKFE